jgi:putative oxidoreductase
MLDTFSRYALVPLLLRLGLAAVFIYHGLEKVSPDKHFGANWYPGIAVPEPAKVPAQLATAWGELLGGVALAVGFLPRVAAAGLILIMAGAIATETGQNGFSILKHGWEYHFVLIVMGLGVLLLGGGPLGLGRWLGHRRPRS